MIAYCALDLPRPAYDYNCTGNIIAYDGYTKNDYAIDGYRDEGHAKLGYYDDDYIYASLRRKKILLLLLMLILKDYVIFCNSGVRLKTS